MPDSRADAPPPQPAPPLSVYAASRASLPERPAMWQRLRANGARIISSWIDEAEPNATADISELWVRIWHEIASADVLVLYAEAGDFPLKGALVEVGIALGMGKPVRIVCPNVALEARSFKPLGSWSQHPAITFFRNVEDATTAALSGEDTAQHTKVKQKEGKVNMLRCSLCGASRLMHKGKPGVCTFVECKDPFYDLKRETPVVLSGETPPPVCFVCAAPATKHFCEAHQNRGTGSPLAPLETPAPARPEAGARPDGLQWRKDNGIEMRGVEFAQLDVRNGAMKRWMTLDDILNEFAEAYVQQQIAQVRFAPLGDNHHNAAACPYCNPEYEKMRTAAEQLAQREQEHQVDAIKLQVAHKALLAETKERDRAREALRLALIPLAALVLSGECVDAPSALTEEIKLAIIKAHDAVLAALATPAMPEEEKK